MQRTLFDSDDYQSNIQETSRQSLKELGQETISERYKEYLNSLWELDQPSTDQEVSKHLGHADPNYFRPRRFELENKYGFIMECKARCCNITGKMAKTFWFTNKGLEMIR
jgi:hypothetical protein